MATLRFTEEDGAFAVTKSRASRLGGGGFGAVYRATLHGEPVAAKTFHALANPMDFGLDSADQLTAIVGTVNTELAALAALGAHVNIVTWMGVVVGSCLGVEVPKWILMELCDGGSLEQRIHATTAPLAYAEIGDIARQIASGLEFLHAHEFIHRDIKPANILFNTLGVVKIADLGLSVIVPAIGESTTGAMTTCGTPLYIAPEIQGSGKYGWQVDIFALGLILCEMLLTEAPPLARDARKAYMSRAASMGKIEGEASAEFEALADIIRSTTFVAPERRPMASIVATKLLASLPPQTSLNIVNVRSGKKLPLDVEATLSIGVLRCRVAELFGLSVATAESTIRLIFEGSPLNDPLATVASLDLARGSILQFVTIVPAPTAPPLPTAAEEAKARQREKAAAVAKEKAIEAKAVAEKVAAVQGRG